MQNRKSVRTGFAALLLVCLCSSTLVAQTFDDAETGSEASSQADQSSAPPTPAPVTASSDPASAGQIQPESGEFNTFVPSEDISEDYSVPFPVDI